VSGGFHALLARVISAAPPAGPSYHAETIAYAAACVGYGGAALSTPRLAAVDALVGALKTAGLWTKLKQMLLLAAHDSIAARVNLKAPGDALVLEVNAPSFVADEGYQGDGATSYLESVGHNAGTIDFTDASMWAHSLLLMDSTLAGLGGWALNTTEMRVRLNSTGGTRLRLAASSNATTPAAPGHVGWLAQSRSGTTSTVTIETTHSAPTTITNSTPNAAVALRWCALLTTTFSTHKLAVVGYGTALSTGETDTLRGIVRDYLTTVGAI
jgi:hypothetical protein